MKNLIWRASVASETVLGVDNAKSGICYWRASEASETLSGVTQSRFRYIYWRASVASETLTGARACHGYKPCATVFT